MEKANLLSTECRAITESKTTACTQEASQTTYSASILYSSVMYIHYSTTTVFPCVVLPTVVLYLTYPELYNSHPIMSG